MDVADGTVVVAGATTGWVVLNAPSCTVCGAVNTAKVGNAAAAGSKPYPCPCPWPTTIPPDADDMVAGGTEVAVFY